MANQFLCTQHGQQEAKQIRGPRDLTYIVCPLRFTEDDFAVPPSALTVTLDSLYLSKVATHELTKSGGAWREGYNCALADVAKRIRRMQER